MSEGLSGQRRYRAGWQAAEAPGTSECVLDSELRRAVRDQNDLTLVVVEAHRECARVTGRGSRVDFGARLGFRPDSSRRCQLTDARRASRKAMSTRPARSPGDWHCVPGDRRLGPLAERLACTRTRCRDSEEPGARRLESTGFADRSVDASREWPLLQTLRLGGRRHV